MTSVLCKSEVLLDICIRSYVLHQRKLIPLEIKSAMTWNREFAANVQKFQHSIPDAAKGYVVYAGDLFPEDEHFRAVHFSRVSQCFQNV